MEKIEVIVRSSRLHDKRSLTRLKKRLLSEINAVGPVSLMEVERPSGKGPAAVLVLTGGVEREVLKLLSQLPSPALLIAHSGHNSLAASLEVLARIRQDGGEGQILFGTPEEIATVLLRELRITSAWENLRFSRIGVIGEPSEWLIASDVERAFLKGRLSIQLVEIDMDVFLQRIESTSSPKREVTRLTKEATSLNEGEVSGEELEKAVSIYAALRSLVEEYRLAACTVRCFDLVTRLQTTGCYALSRLNDEEIPAGCEGDLQALFSLYIGFLVSGQAGFMGNIAWVASTEGKMILAHCTCPLSLAAGYVIRSHFESRCGVGLAATIPEGPCTIFRLGGKRLDRLFIREGRIETSSPREDLCRTQVMIAVNEPIDRLLTAPLGNHHIVLPGHHRESIERFFMRFLAA
jgi:L-fucose isomerase-like protein